MTRYRLAISVATIIAVACSDPLPTPPGTGGPPVRPTVPQTYRPSGHAAAGDVMVHLFEWRWDDIATECETVLGPAGVHAVQISPPQEHSITTNFDWSERYQPVRYNIDRSRSGTRAQFIDMVNRCRARGVGIIVDAVINHMTNFPSPGTGSANSPYEKYSYPGLYTAADFHVPCALTNYQSAANVQDCELFSLPDLRTESPTVREKIVGFLMMLVRLGVEGFRIDAAKHIQQGDLDAIIDSVNAAAVRESFALPYWFLEVVGNGQGEAVGPRDYFGIGYSSGGAADITEFTTTGLGDKFRRVGGQFLAQLNPDGTPGNQYSPAAWNLLPADKAVIFLQNHDTQHNVGAGCRISYRDGQVFRLANAFLLAHPYGYPSVLSSYAFNCGDGPSGTSMGPPSDASGWTTNVVCAASMEAATTGQWICEHRDPYIRNMVGFRRVVAGAPIANWWDNTANAIAFSRGTLGFIAINREDTTVTATIPTGLAQGSYCDRITGGRVTGACAGTTITVGAGGAQVSLAPLTAVAIDTTTKLP